IRYQHVRNVIVQDEQKGRSLPSAASPETEVRWVEVAADGRMTLPIAYRKILGVENGGSVFVTIDDSGLRLESRAVALKRVRDMVAPYLKGRPSMVDELIAERHAEAAREDLS
ncbi:MAG: hypothetical protein SFV21_04930, partial [Rhodospirillaceae bacterium]|nr:hypothetical protein [Rhodospirillaceae bacterium]